MPSNDVLVRLYESKVFEPQITIGVVVHGEANLSKKFKIQPVIHMADQWRRPPRQTDRDPSLPLER